MQLNIANLQFTYMFIEYITIRTEKWENESLILLQLSYNISCNYILHYFQIMFATKLSFV